MNLEDLYRLLRTNHVQAQGIIDTLQGALLVLDQAGCVINGNRAFFEKFGFERDAVIGRSLYALGKHQWNVPELRRLLDEVIPKSAAIIGFEVAADFPPIGQRTMLVSARRLAHPDNNSTSILVLFEDVTERRHDESEKDILLAETRHRMKNLLAVVQALANQTEVEGRTGTEYRDAFLGRFAAVLRAEDMALAKGAETDLRALIEQALEPLGPHRSHIDGPPVFLTQEQTLPLSLILHELATNALKYGAHSAAQGVVNVTWRVASAEGRTVVHIDWREEGGPPVTPPKGSGFGTRLIQFSATQSLEGSVQLNFEPGGLQVHVTVPLH